MFEYDDLFRISSMCHNISLQLFQTLRVHLCFIKIVLVASVIRISTKMDRKYVVLCIFSRILNRTNKITVN